MQVIPELAKRLDALPVCQILPQDIYLCRCGQPLLLKKTAPSGGSVSESE